MLSSLHRIIAISALWLAFIAPAGLCGTALAQSIPAIPEAIVRNGPSGAGEEQAVRDAAQAIVALLKAGVIKTDDPASAAVAAENFYRGRRALIDPLRSVDCSPLFRTFYADVLDADLRAFAQGEDDRLAVAAIYAAGDLATGKSIEIIRAQAAGTNLVRRYAGFAAHGRVFTALARSEPALREDDVASLTEALLGAVQKETDPDIYDVQIRSLLDATALSGRFASQGEAATRGLALGMAERLRALNGDPAHEQFLTTNLVVLDDLRNRILNDFRKSIPDQVVYAAAALAGETVASIGREVRKGGLPTGEAGAQARHLRGNSLRLAETIIFQVKDRYGIRDPGEALDLAKRIEAGTAREDQLFLQDLLKVIGPSGVLRDPRFKFAPAWFSF